MSQLTVRNVPDEVVRALRIRAARNGRSAEEEHRRILKSALADEENEFWARADALRKTMPKQRSDSTRLLRRMRDER